MAQKMKQAKNTTQPSPEEPQRVKEPLSNGNICSHLATKPTTSFCPALQHCSTQLCCYWILPLEGTGIYFFSKLLRTENAIVPQTETKESSYKCHLTRISEHVLRVTGSYTLLTVGFASSTRIYCQCICHCPVLDAGTGIRVLCQHQVSSRSSVHPFSVSWSYKRIRWAVEVSQILFLPQLSAQHNFASYSCLDKEAMKWPPWQCALRPLEELCHFCSVFLLTCLHTAPSCCSSNTYLPQSPLDKSAALPFISNEEKHTNTCISTQGN